MYKRYEGEVVTLLTTIGEVIGKLTEVRKEKTGSGLETCLIVESPRMFAQTQDGVGFAPGIGMTGKPEPKTASFNLAHVITVTEPHPSVADSWREMVSGLVVANTRPNIVGIDGGRKQ